MANSVHIFTTAFHPVNIFAAHLARPMHLTRLLWSPIPSVLIPLLTDHLWATHTQTLDIHHFSCSDEHRKNICMCLGYPLTHNKITLELTDLKQQQFSWLPILWIRNLIRSQLYDPTISLGVLSCGWNVQNRAWPLCPAGQSEFKLVLVSKRKHSGRGGGKPQIS